MTKRKILYLSDTAPGSKNGGAIIEYRNRRILGEKYAIEDVNVFFEHEMTFTNKLINVFFSKVPMGYNPKQSMKIERIIAESDADTIFIETSKMGGFAKTAKKAGMNVVVYFQNCEKDYWLATKGYQHVYFVEKQEQLSLKYADLCIFLNSRDKQSIENHYRVKCKNCTTIPISFNDIITLDIINNMKKHKKGNKGLFYGSLFGPNYNGIKWFVENVSNRIEGSIDIVGVGFENCSELKRDNVNVIGTVEDLRNYICEVDYVLFPIFEGSGMKVKTCEALMYGKKIFATDEALEGYEVENTEICRCNTAEEFADQINSFLNSDQPIYCEKTRDLFSKKYEEMVIQKCMIDSIDSIMK